MPLTFDSDFATAILLKRLVIFWAAILHLGDGDVFIAEEPGTFGGDVFTDVLSGVGDISAITSRKDPTQLDLAAVTIAYNNMLTYASNHLSDRFDTDLEAAPIDLLLVAQKPDLSFVRQLMFKGVSQSPPADYNYKDGTLSLLSFVQKFFDVQVNRVLSEVDFPFIGGDNGKAVPWVFGNVYRAPGRIVKERPWSIPRETTGSSTSGVLSDVSIGDSAVTEDITITFSSDEDFTVVGSVTGAMGSGTVDAEFVYPAVPSISNLYRLKIDPAAWQGAQTTGNVWQFTIDVSTRGEVVFSESPTATPVSEVRDLWWSDYVIVSDRSVKAVNIIGTLATQIPVGTDNKNSASEEVPDAPILTLGTFGTNSSFGILAGKYQYEQTIQRWASEPGADFVNSNPSQAADIDVSDPEVPLPTPSNPPRVDATGTYPFGGGVDAGQHRWAFTYVSKYGETPLGTPSETLLVENGFMQPPTVEPELEAVDVGVGPLFGDENQSALTWGFVYQNRYGKTTMGPTRSVQVIDASFFKLTMRVRHPGSIPTGATVLVYRTAFRGGLIAGGSQLNETGDMVQVGSISGITGYFDDNVDPAFFLGSTDIQENTTGGPDEVTLTDIAVGPPGTVSKRIYRTAAGDKGPFKLVGIISNDDTTFVDNMSDAIAGNSAFGITDFRTSPYLPLDKDLSGDKTSMYGHVHVQLPGAKSPSLPGHPYRANRVWRTKKDASGTFYLHSDHSQPLLSFDDFTPDASLGNGLDQDDRPTDDSSAEQSDNFTAQAMRLRITKPLLAYQLRLMIGKVGAPTGDIQVRIVTDAGSQPTGNTLCTVTIPESDIDLGVGFRTQRLETPTIIPRGITWFVVETPNSDADNYYLMGYASDIPSGAVRFAHSSKQNKWIAQGGCFCFAIDGATFTLEASADDYTGKPVAIAKFNCEVPSGTNVSCSMTGITDDGDGTYTGSAGDVITSPEDVAHFVASAIGGLPTANVDLAGSFADTAAKYVGTKYFINGAAQEVGQTVKSLLMQIGKESRSIPGWSGDLLTWTWLPTRDDIGTPTRTIEFTDIIGSDDGPMLTTQRLGRSEVVNIINLRWARNAWLDLSDDKAFGGTVRRDDPVSVGIYGELERTDPEDLFDMIFVKNDTQAIDLAEFYLSRLSLPDARRVTVSLALPFLDVKEDDVIEFDLGTEGAGSTPGSPFGGGSFGGGSFGGGGVPFDGLVPGLKFQVEGKTLKSDMSVELVVREL